MNDTRKIRRQTLEEISFCGLALALSLIFLGLGYVLPFSSLFIIIFVPILTALVAARCRIRTQLLFAFALALCCFVDIQDGLFYLLPNALIGLVFGNFVRRLAGATWIFLMTAATSFALNALMFFPIKLVFGVDMIATYGLIFGCTREQFVPLYPLFCFLLAVAETFILYAVAIEEMKKFGYQIDEELDFDTLGCFSLLLLSAAAGCGAAGAVAAASCLLSAAILPSSLIAIELALRLRFKSIFYLLFLASAGCAVIFGVKDLKLLYLGLAPSLGLYSAFYLLFFREKMAVFDLR